jgi:phosphonate transport system substrate-binding protein
MPVAFFQTNHNDVEAALKVLAESIALKRGFAVTVITHSFSNSSAFNAAIMAGEINFAVYDPLSYVTGRRPADLIPVFIPSDQGTRGRRYMVLVRRDSGLHRMEDLRGKSLKGLHTPDVSVGHAWLQALTRAQGADSPKDFFRTIDYVSRPTAAVLPVFFGKQDACLVDNVSFDLMKELNPQVGSQLFPILTSEPLIGAVICVSEANWSSPDFRPALIHELANLHLDPAGRQILNLFRMDQLVPFEESQLEAVRALVSTDLGTNVPSPP